MKRRELLMLPALGTVAGRLAETAPTAPRYLYMFHNLNSFIDPEDQRLAVEAYRGMDEVARRHGITVDPFFTGLSFEMYLRNAPELLEELKRSGRDYHHHGANRAPKPMPVDRVGRKPWGEAVQAVEEYEQYGLDPRTGQLDKTRTGGLKKMVAYFGRPPLATGRFIKAPIMAATKDTYGVRMGVGTHDWFGVPSAWIWYMGTLNRPDDFFVHPNWDFADWVRVEWAKKNGRDPKSVQRARPNEPWDIYERVPERLKQLDPETPAFLVIGFHNNDLFGFNTETKTRYEPAYRKFFLERMDEFLGWLTNKQGAVPKNLRQAYEMAKAHLVDPSPGDARVLATQIVESVDKEKTLPLYVRSPRSGHSLVEAWQVLAATLSGSPLKVRDWYGPTEPAPKLGVSPAVPAEQIRATARSLPGEANSVPSRVKVGGAEVNAGEFLYLMAKVALGARAAEVAPMEMTPPVAAREDRFGDPLSLLQMWTLKPAYYGKLGGRLQLATSVDVNLQTGRMQRTNEMRLLRPEDRPPY